MKRVAALIAVVAIAAGFVGAGNTAGSRWWSYVSVLADDQMQGRNTGSPGHRKAAEWLASQFQQLGLKPAGVNGYIQPVKFDGRKIDESRSSVELIRDGKAERLALGEDVTVTLRINPAESIEAPLVFAGYGLVVPESNFNDFAGLDVRGKVIVTFAGGPSTIPGNLRAHYGYATERQKFLQQAGAVGLVTIANPHTADIPWARATLARLQEAMSLAEPALTDLNNLKIGLNVNAAHADKWLAGSGHTIDELLALVDAGKPLPHFPLVPSLRAKVAVQRRQVESQNIAAVLPGSDPSLRNEYVVLSAHIDHLGVGEPINGDSIYNGAMDNASGIASMLDIAQTLHDSKTVPKRSLLFVAVTGEEKGLLGSRYFAAHPTVDRSSMVADLNLDMFLPIHPLRLLTAYGLTESALGDDVRAVAKTMKLDVQDDPEPQRNVFVRSDQYNFIRLGVPSILMAFGAAKGSADERLEKAWLTNRYHAPSDDLRQPVDLKAADDFNHFMLTLTQNVANSASRPQWKSGSFFRRFSAPAAATR